MSSSFSLQEAVPADVPALAELSSAFDTDRHTQLKAAHPTRPYNHTQETKKALSHWINVPKSRLEITKAVDDTTGEIIGMVAWAFRLQQTPQPAQAEKDNKDSTAADQDGDKSQPGADALAQLNDLTSTHLADFMARITADGSTRSMFIVSIVVHPKHQGRGVGTALVKKGTAMADAEGVIAWVHASEAGANLFRKCGFELEDTLEIDLDKPAAEMGIKPPPGHGKWGKYTFRYFVRQPSHGASAPT